MKKLFILTISILLIPQLLQAKSALPDPDTSYANLDPFGAIDLCGKEQYVQYFASEYFGLPCNAGNVKAYYQFRTIEEASGVEIATFGTTPNSSYTLYGPFSTLQEGAMLINQMAAPIIETGAGASSHVLEIDTEENKVYILEVTIFDCNAAAILFYLQPETMSCVDPIVCSNCIPAFNPPGGKYVLSAWVKEEDALPTTTSYTEPSIEISFIDDPLTVYTFTPSGQIIDGWQRIESIFETPGGSLKIKLQVASGNAFFDDIRIFPFDGSMISYVYDPLTLRLLAELDERNYAKIYEYDEEGKLTRVKKETEKGIMTIQENRESSVKKP